MADPVRRRAPHDVPPERLETGYEHPSETRDARDPLTGESEDASEPDYGEPRPRGGVRGFVDEIFLAGVGAVALTKERVDELVDELAGRGELTREEARDVLEDARARWRGDASRIGERAGVSLAGALRELGLVTHREWEDVELRLSQLEHRLRLVEREGQDPPAPKPGPRPRGGARRP